MLRLRLLFGGHLGCACAADVRSSVVSCQAQSGRSVNRRFNTCPLAIGRPRDGWLFECMQMSWTHPSSGYLIGHHHNKASGSRTRPPPTTGQQHPPGMFRAEEEKWMDASADWRPLSSTHWNADNGLTMASTSRRQDERRQLDRRTVGEKRSKKIKIVAPQVKWPRSD